MNKPTTVATTDALFAIASAIGDLACSIEQSGKEIREGLNSVAFQIRQLGNGDAATTEGAVEAYGKFMGEKMDHLTEVIGDFADALREASCEKENGDADGGRA
jgi:hypothetical protein